MARKDEYLRKADEVTIQAAGMIGSQRDAMLKLALDWRALSERAGESHVLGRPKI